MRHMVRASLLAVALVLATAATTQATTTRIPFSGSSTLIDVPSFGVETDVGGTVHVRDTVLVYLNDAGNPRVDGTTIVTINFVFGPSGNAWWSKELWSSTAYPGEGFTCSGSGHRDAIGRIFGSDHCQGFGEHLGGWQMRG